MEYLACLEELRALLESGYSAQRMYDEMREKGVISMSYSHFNKYLGGRVPGVAGLRAMGARKAKKATAPGGKGHSGNGASVPVVLNVSGASCTAGATAPGTANVGTKDPSRFSIEQESLN